jgi:ABC-type multidrug transport system ATPase subunit
VTDSISTAAALTDSRPVLEIQDLTVRYRFRTAVKNLSLQVSAGHCLGLLGANGAGKTSTIRAILGLVRPAKGIIRIFGNSPGALKGLALLGFAPEEGCPPEYLTGKEYLVFVARMRSKEDRQSAVTTADKLLADFELAPDKKIRDYSKGMRRRLVLAQAFVGTPKILILDEPLNGLDPLMILKLREYLSEYRKNGGSLLYSSHILSEVERTCTHIAILQEGELVLSDSMENIVNSYGSVEGAFSKKANAPVVPNDAGPNDTTPQPPTLDGGAR